MAGNKETPRASARGECCWWLGGLGGRRLGLDRNDFEGDNTAGQFDLHSVACFLADEGSSDRCSAGDHHATGRMYPFGEFVTGAQAPFDRVNFPWILEFDDVSLSGAICHNTKLPLIGSD